MATSRQYYWDLRYSPEMEFHMLTICPKDFFDQKHYLSDDYNDYNPAVEIINASMPFKLVEDAEAVFSLLPEWVEPVTNFLSAHPQFIKGAAFTIYMNAHTDG